MYIDVDERSDAAVERILAMTDEEIYAEIIAEGRDPDKVAADVRAIFDGVIKKYRLREILQLTPERPQERKVEQNTLDCLLEKLTGRITRRKRRHHET